MRELARRLEVTPTAIYHYYDGKEAIVRALCDEGLQKLLNAQLKLKRIKDPIERLYQHGLAYLDMSIRDPDFFWILFVAPTFDWLQDDSSLQRGDIEEDSYAMGLSIIRDVLKNSKSRVSPARFMHAFWALLHGVACLEIAFRSEPSIKLFDPREQYEFGYEVLLKGLEIK